MPFLKDDKYLEQAEKRLIPMTSLDFDAALAGLSELEAASLDLICTAPPFDLLDLQLDGTKIQLGKLITRFTPITRQFARVLKPEGSLILELEWLKGQPVRSPFHYELIVHLCKPIEAGGEGWQLAEATLPV